MQKTAKNDQKSDAQFAPLVVLTLPPVSLEPTSKFQDSLAEWSKALAEGASPQGRGFEPHSCHLWVAQTHKDRQRQTETKQRHTKTDKDRQRPDRD